MSFQFDPATHTYTLGGRRLFSVTEILDFHGFISEFSKDEERAHIGQAAHLACQLDDEHDLMEGSIHSVIRPYLDAWRLFKAESAFIPEQIETPLYLEDLGFAGTPDRLGVGFKNKKLLVDIKTGSKQKYWGFQLAGYCILAPGRIPYVVQLMPDGRYKCHSYLATIVEDMAVFQAALTITRVKEGM